MNSSRRISLSSESGTQASESLSGLWSVGGDTHGGGGKGCIQAGTGQSLQTATFFVLGGTGNTLVTKVELVSCLPLPRQEHMPNT